MVRLALLATLGIIFAALVDGQALGLAAIQVCSVVNFARVPWHSAAANPPSCVTLLMAMTTFDVLPWRVKFKMASPCVPSSRFRPKPARRAFQATEEVVGYQSVKHLRSTYTRQLWELDFLSVFAPPSRDAFEIEGANNRFEGSIFKHLFILFVEAPCLLHYAHLDSFGNSIRPIGKERYTRHSVGNAARF